MPIEITVYGEKMMSDDPRKRKFYIEAYDREPGKARGEPIEKMNLLGTLAVWIETLENWRILTPRDEPWYLYQQCPFCKKAVEKRWKRMGTTFPDWHFQFCKRHAAAEFLFEVSLVDNKKREIIINGDELTLFVNTNRHEGKYKVSKYMAIATLDGRSFTYRPHVNSWPFSPTYNRVLEGVRRLLNKLIDVLENPQSYAMTVYYNDEIIYQP